MLWTLRLCLLLLPLALGGCGSRFVYERLDTLARWELEDYVELSESQEAFVRERLAAQLERHRREALPRYAAWLRALDADLAEPLDRPRLDRHFERFHGLRQELLRQFLPDITLFLASLGDEQIDALFEALEEDNRDYAEDYVALPKDKLVKKRLRELSGSLRDWIGALNPAQQERLSAWTGRIHLLSTEQLAYQRRWQAELRAALGLRQDAVRFGARLEALFLAPEALRSGAFQAKLDHNIDAFRTLLLDLDRMLKPGQKHKLRKRLRSYAGDFEAWAKDV